MIWLVFAYGLQVYVLLGSQAEKEFVRSFGIGIGIKALMDFKDTFVDAIELLLVVTLLEPLIISKSRWLESHVDLLVSAIVRVPTI